MLVSGNEDGSSVRLLRGTPRDEILRRLQERPWFTASSEVVRAKLLGLPGALTDEDRAAKRFDQNCDGYLADLASRPTVGGGVRVRRVLDVLIPDGRIFGIFTNLEVEKVADPSIVFAYQYFSWRQGPECGAKGLVLIEDAHGRISHVAMLAGFSFAPGMDTTDLPGGFAEVDEQGVKGMLARFDGELREELGVPNLTIKRVISLGSYHPDRGLTNERPELFAAVIDASTAERIPVGEWKNPDPFEMRSVPNILPVERLWGQGGVLMTSTDGFLLACVARLIATGVLTPPSAT